jgi:hypothetical protein
MQWLFLFNPYWLSNLLTCCQALTKQTNSHLFKLPIKSHKINLVNISCAALNIHKQKYQNINFWQNIILFHFFMKLDNISWDNKFLQRRQLKDTNVKPNTFHKLQKKVIFHNQKTLFCKNSFQNTSFFLKIFKIKKINITTHMAH